MAKATDKAIRRAFEKRTRKAQSILRELSDVYEEKEPDWFPLTLLDLITGGLRSLRHCIEDPRDKDISWKRPVVEAQYPVEWDWKRDDWKAASWTLADLTREHLPETLKQTFLSLRNLYALELVTKGVGYRKSGNSYEPILRHDVREDFYKLPEEDQPEALEKLFEPVTIGGMYADVPDKEGGPTATALVAEPVDKAESGLFFQGTVGGKPVSVSLVAAFHPLVVDEDTRRAYYPIVAALVIQAFPLPDPEAWEPEDRAAFWEDLFGGLEEIRKDWPALEVEQPALVPGTPPAERIFPVAFGRTLGDAEVLSIVHSVRKIHLPRRWSALPSWEDLQREEVQRILDEHGEGAFQDLRRETKTPTARGALLSRRQRRGEEIITLTAEAERLLKIKKGLGGGGYRYTQSGSGEEYLCRLFQVSAGYLEVGLSWYGIAGPWVEDWRREFGRRAADAERGERQVRIFEDLDPGRQAKVNRFLREARAMKDARAMMEMILGQVGIQGTNPVRIPAESFRVLLDLETDRNWKARIDGALSALGACRFRINTFDMEKLEGGGVFLAEWFYMGAGGVTGRHGRGDYFLHITSGFVGCLSIFESGSRRLPPGVEAMAYDFGRKPTKEDKAALGWGGGQKTRAYFSGFDAGAVFYNAAQGLTPEQSSLVHFLETEETLKKDGVSRKIGTHTTRAAGRISAGTAGAEDPRIYGPDFCPVLPKGKRYHGALGHFKRHPETGRTLYGTKRRPSATGGAHSPGLIHVLGYHLPTGRAGAARARIVRQALGDFKAVVVEYLGGIIAARGPGGEWLTLEEASRLPEADLCRRTKWLFFLPSTWRMDRKQKWEEQQKERAERGETPFAWKITEDPREAERGRAALRGDVPAGETDPRPLRHLLRSARLERGLSLREAGDLFGVSKGAVSQWETGPEPDPDGRVRGKPIPSELVSLVRRWVESGEAPKAEDLAARKTRRSGGNSRTRKSRSK